MELAWGAWIMGGKMDRRFRKGARLSAPIWEAMCKRIAEVRMDLRIAVSKDLWARVTDDSVGVAARFYNGDGPFDCIAILAKLDAIGGGMGTELECFRGAPRDVLTNVLTWMAEYRIDEVVGSDNVLTAYGVDMRRGVLA